MLGPCDQGEWMGLMFVVGALPRCLGPSWSLYALQLACVLFPHPAPCPKGGRTCLEFGISALIFGATLATVLGLGHPRLVEMGGFSPKVEKENVCLIGIRDIDDNERKIIRESGIHAYTMRDVDERGMREIMEEAIEFATNGTAGFHMSFDLDGMDPRDVPGTGTPVKGGIDWREANLLMEMVSDTGKMCSLEVTELNPILDVKNQSGEVAVDVICSAFGKRIL